MKFFVAEQLNTSWIMRRSFVKINSKKKVAFLSSEYEGIHATRRTLRSWSNVA